MELRIDHPWRCYRKEVLNYERKSKSYPAAGFNTREMSTSQELAACAGDETAPLMKPLEQGARAFLELGTEYRRL